ncbi:MAG: heavy metal-binding domain-containing protein [Pseudomonadota bacterium]
MSTHPIVDDMLLQLFVLLVLLALGYLFGTRAERKHLAELDLGETMLKRLPVFPEKQLPAFKHAPRTLLVSGSVVMSADYFKRFFASFASLFGGNLRYYETLLSRGEREALLRMRLAAQHYGAEAVFNVKIETVSLSKNARKRIGSIEVLAYGTAVIPTRTTRTNWQTGRFKQPLDTLEQSGRSHIKQT